MTLCILSQSTTLPPTPGSHCLSSGCSGGVPITESCWVICHFSLIELENLRRLVHLQLLQRGVDALQMRGISFPRSLLHGNLIRFCMTDHRKQQKVWRSFLLEPDKRNARIKTSREQKKQSWLKGYSTGSNSLFYEWLFNNLDIL